jgi:hypothetical protein
MQQPELVSILLLLGLPGLDVRQMFLIEHGFPIEQDMLLTVAAFFCGTRSSGTMASSVRGSVAPAVG